MKQYNIILSSKSPRRRELLAGLGLEFEVKVIAGIDESYPADMSAADVPQYIACKKADAYEVGGRDLVITADTLVMAEGEILGKPRDTADARRMLRLLSGRRHQVTTGVCMVSAERRSCFSVTTDVAFKELSDEEIDYYIEHYRPFDKAGAYGIQEWIGYIGVTSLHGSYFNVMGLPVQRIYNELTSTFGVKFG